jgi:hypothetical protein
MILFSNPAILAAFARDERTKFLLNCSDDFEQWTRFAHDCSDTICDACEDSAGKLICEFSETVIGCTNCFAYGGECSTVDSYKVAAFQWTFGVEHHEVLEFMDQFYEFKSHFSSNRYEWTS